MKKITNTHSLTVDYGLSSEEDTFIPMASLMDFFLKATDAGANHMRFDINRNRHDGDLESIELIAVEIRDETPEEEEARKKSAQDQGEKYALISKQERERQYLELKKEFDPNN